MQIDPETPTKIDCWLSIHTLFNTNDRYSDTKSMVADWYVCISNLGGFSGMVIKTKIGRNLASLTCRVTTQRNFVESWFRPPYLDTLRKWDTIPPPMTEETINIE
jgi:hypothetical protein